MCLPDDLLWPLMAMAILHTCQPHYLDALMATAVVLGVDTDMVDRYGPFPLIHQLKLPHAFQHCHWLVVVLRVEIDRKEACVPASAPKVLVVVGGREVVVADIEARHLDLGLYLVGLEVGEVVGHHQKHPHLVRRV